MSTEQDGTYKVPYEQLGGKAKMLADMVEGVKERQLELDFGDTEPLPWDVGTLPITYVEYNMKRLGVHWYMDEELTLEALRGFKLGDTFVLIEEDNPTTSTKDKYPKILSLKKTGNVSITTDSGETYAI
jgi:hypothetical protein